MNLIGNSSCIGEIQTKKIRVYGIVQGVGFRPTVSRHAAAAGIRGTVCNCGPYVEILAQGTAAQIESFLSLLEEQPPRRAAILKLLVMDPEPAEQGAFEGFSIIESAKIGGEIFISPDIAICEDCKKELYDRNDRRYLHPFINCTSCGPRMTILDLLPYDRERTSMGEFPMCPDCAAEYHSPETRRYDAQPVCCPSCGPEVYELLTGPDRKPAGRGRRGPAAITEARRIVAQGGIIAVKGIGGYHLCCDASNPKAVNLLRQRKKRPVKPFAVMLRNLEAARRECRMEAYQEKILDGHQKPILLLEKKDGGQVCREAAPGNPKLGIMLPYAPVQLLLFDYDDSIVMPDCLVMTSANASGAPICRSEEDAAAQLTELCDYILSNDRKIRIRADDTVMDFYGEKPYMIRRSRGYAPLPFMSSRQEQGCALALGGELKNAFCIAAGGLYYPSPYVGDLADLRTVKALRETAGRFEALLEARPEIIACDPHPGYNSTAFAKELAAERGLPLLAVQHHYAHILSCMAENDVQEPVIGVAFDGTGYGADGSIWGGEILLCSPAEYRRMGSITPFTQCGGDLSAKEGWRIAVSMLYDMTGNNLEKTLQAARRLSLCDEQQVRMTVMMKERGINAVTSTSAGRLFDAVSAVLGIRKASSFEGEASMFLQYAAMEWERKMADRQDAVSDGIGRAENVAPDRCAERTSPAEGTEGAAGAEEAELLQLDTAGIFAGIAGAVLDLCEENNKKLTDMEFDAGFMEELAYRFHRELAEETVRVCCAVREKTGCSAAALSGGVFQNTLLLGLTADGLAEAGFTVYTHSMVPPNDGGIALGQAYAAMGELEKRRKKGETALCV